MKPLVSILIPAFNAQEWISDTIQSALAQSWPRKEIVIVNDGSTDDTLAVARRHIGKGVKLVSQPNLGGAAARNTALAHSQGDYIQWLDADDLLAPDKIAQQMQVVEKYGEPRILLSSAWAYFRYRAGVAKFSPSLLWNNLSPLDWVLTKWAHNLHMQTATWLVSRQLTEAAGPWNTELLGDDDGEYFTRVVLATAGIHFVPEAKVFYRIVGAGRLSYIGQSDRKLEAQFRSMQLQIGYALSVSDEPRVRAAILKYLQCWLPQFYPERPDLVDQARRLALNVGGDLKTPGVGWKYAWLDAMVGRAATKRAQLRYNQGKTFLLRSWDRLLYQTLGA